MNNAYKKGRKTGRFSKSSDSFFQNEKIRKKTYFLPMNCLNIFFQPRQTFIQSKLEDLALSINRNGLMHPLLVARFTKKEMEEHIKLRNSSERQVVKLELEALHKFEDHYYVLIAGERRYRAVSMIIKNIQGIYHGSSLYTFYNKKIECSLYYSPSFLKFISMQLDENDQGEKPPSHEEAEYIDSYYGAMKVAAKDEKIRFTLSGFARKIGKSPQVVRTALRFSELPVLIKQFVKAKTISYGVACEITRLNTGVKIKDSELLWWANLAVAKKANVKDFKIIIDKALQRKRASTINLFEDNQVTVLRSIFRSTMDKNVGAALYVNLNYLKKVNSLFENNYVGKEDSVFASPPIIKQVGSIVDILINHILPHIESLKNEPYFKKAMKEVKQLELVSKIKEVEEKFNKIR